MASPILLNSTLSTSSPIIVHTTTTTSSSSQVVNANSTNSNNHSVKPSTSNDVGVKSSSSTLLRRPTFTSSIDVLSNQTKFHHQNNSIAANNGNNHTNNHESTFLTTTKTRDLLAALNPTLNTTSNDNIIASSAISSNSNPAFNVNDSFYLHQLSGMNNRNHYNFLHDTADSSSMFGDVSSAANSYTNNTVDSNTNEHIKNIFTNIKNEQQQLSEQGSNVRTTALIDTTNHHRNYGSNTIPRSHVRAKELLISPMLLHDVDVITTNDTNTAPDVPETDASSVAASTTTTTCLSLSAKPKKRVSFNENLLKVHLIPTNAANSAFFNQHQMSEMNQLDEQTTFTTIQTPTIINSRKLLTSSKYYKTTRPLMQAQKLNETLLSNGHLSSTTPQTTEQIHLLNEFKRYNTSNILGFSVASNPTTIITSATTTAVTTPQQQATTNKSAKSLSLNSLNRSSSVLTTRPNNLTSDSNESLNSINNISNSNLFKLSIKSIKLNNSNGGITIQPITANSIKSAMTIEPLTIKQKGFLYEQYQQQQQQQQNHHHHHHHMHHHNHHQHHHTHNSKHYEHAIYPKFMNTSGLMHNEHEISSSVPLSHFSDKENDADNSNATTRSSHLRLSSSKKLKSSLNGTSSWKNDKNDSTLIDVTHKTTIKSPYIVNESVPLYTNNLIFDSTTSLSTSSNNYSQAPLTVESSTKLLLSSPQTSIFVNNNEQLTKKLIKLDSNNPINYINGTLSNSQTSLNTNSSANSNNKNTKNSINQQLIVLRNANLINTSPTPSSTSSVVSNNKKNDTIHRQVSVKALPTTATTTTNMTTSTTAATNSANLLSSSDLRRTHSALPVLLRNNGMISNSNNKMHQYNNIVAQSKLHNHNLLNGGNGISINSNSTTTNNNNNNNNKQHMTTTTTASITNGSSQPQLGSYRRTATLRSTTNEKVS